MSKSKKPESEIKRHKMVSLNDRELAIIKELTGCESLSLGIRILIEIARGNLLPNKVKPKKVA